MIDKDCFNLFNPKKGKIPDDLEQACGSVVHRAREILKGKTEEQIVHMVIYIDKIIDMYIEENKNKLFSQETTMSTPWLRACTTDVWILRLIYNESNSLDSFSTSKNLLFQEQFAALALSKIGMYISLFQDYINDPDEISVKFMLRTITTYLYEATESIHFVDVIELVDIIQSLQSNNKDFKKQLAKNESNIRKEIARNAADKKNEDFKQLKKYAQKLYLSGSYKSKSQAAREILPKVQEYAKQNNLHSLNENSITEYGTQRAVYDWVREIPHH